MKTILVAILLCLGLSCMSWSNTGSLFTYNKAQVNIELNQLQVLEDFIYSHPDKSLSILLSENSCLLNGLNLSNSFSCGLSMDNEEPLGISPYWWGCCFGVWGIAIVYFVMEDKEATKRALKGCVTHELVGIGCIVVYYVVILIFYAEYASYWYW
jgi:hypothetical protein